MTQDQFLTESNPEKLRSLLLRGAKHIALLEQMLERSQEFHYDGRWDKEWDSIILLALGKEPLEEMAEEPEPA